jgi:hypothetical protein
LRFVTIRDDYFLSTLYTHSIDESVASSDDFGRLLSEE